MSQVVEKPLRDVADRESGAEQTQFKPAVKTRMRGRHWLGRIAIAVCLCAAGLGYASHRMNVADARHAAFRYTGQDIKVFLKNYAKAIDESFKDGDVSRLGQFYADDYRSPQRGKWTLTDPQDLGGATLAQLESETSDPATRSSVLDEWREYLAQIDHIDQVHCKINLIEQADPGNWAVVTVKYVLDGRDLRENLFQDRFFFRWHVQHNENVGGTGKSWQIAKDELVEGVRAAGPSDSFARLSPAQAGIDYLHRRDPKLNKETNRLKFSVVEHAFGGVTAVDVMGDDGLPELMFVDGVECKFYRNVTPTDSDTPVFVDVTVAAGLDGIDQAHTALFFDVDNDGDADLFVTRYMTPSLVYINNGHGRFADRTSDFGLNIVQPCMSACVLDHNQDGFLDLYIAVNGLAAEAAPDIPFFSLNAQPNILLTNVGGSAFRDDTKGSGTDSTGWTLAVTSGDANSDGFPDLLVANDFGRKELLINNGNGTFTDQAKEAGVLDFSGGMGAAFTDLNGDFAPDICHSNIESGQRWYGAESTLWQYMRNIARTRWLFGDLPEYTELYGLLGDDWKGLGLQIGRGNSVFENKRDGTFEEWEDCHAKRAGWAWSVNPFDFDADGDIDLHVSNGWISGPNPTAPDL